MSLKQSKYKLTQSLSTGLLISGLLIAFFAPRWEFLDSIDSQMFRLGKFLLPQPTIGNDINTVLLAEDLMQQPDKIEQLRHALNKLKKNKASSVSLLIPQLPSLDYKNRQDKADKNNKKQSGKDEQQWQLTTGQQTKLSWTISKNKVIVGLPTAKLQTNKFLKRNNESYTDHLTGLFFSKISQQQIPTIHQDYITSPYYTPTYSRSQASLLWADESNNITPDLSLAIYKQSKHIKQHDWISSKGIDLDSEFIQTNYSGKIMTYFSDTDQATANQLDLDALLLLKRNDIKNKLFILGTDRKSLALVANHLNSLTSKATYHTPAWADWIKKSGFIFIFIYLFLFVAKLQKHTTYLLSLLLIFAALVFQYGLLLINSSWLPLISLYMFLLLGHSIVLLKKSMDVKIERLMLHTHDALFQLAQYQFNQGDHDNALTNLIKCSPTSDVLDLMYNIGLGFERRRQYDKAVNLYSDINMRSNDYKDVKKRLQSLFSISGISPDASSPMQAGKTLLMPDLGLQLPVLGRYEIERELGRGAMGVVYLGKDPKINRQVAIKTLDYSQLSESEIKTFKSRFFREAEAAGRLNHNSIVTVYDVGEEDDFAFIAMDYIKGKSLDEFSKPDTLLPVHEVYKIMATVADTLDYAHSQKIVHRDIKPSNIMYEENTHKVKVTDFGIARITDNAHTRTGSFLGSPSYMSPEQMIGANVGSHADIYALGVSFYQLLTGCLPFTADSIGNLAHVIANKKHKPIREIRPELPSSATRIINKALQKKPKDRYNTGKEMADAIRRGMPKE